MEGVERLVIDIIKSTPTDNLKSLFKGMHSKGMFAYFDSKMNDFGGKEHYTMYIKEMARLFRLVYSEECRNSFTISNIGPNYSIHLKQDIKHFGRLTLNSVIPCFTWDNSHFEASYNNNDNVLFRRNRLPIGGDKRGVLETGVPDELKPTDIVVVYFKENPRFVELGSRFEDRLIALPAFMLPYIVTTNKKADAAEFVNTMVTTYSFVMSAGTLTLATKGASTALKIWRGATTLVAFYEVVTLDAKVLLKIKSLGPYGEEFVKWYNDNKDYYNYAINQIGSHSFETGVLSPSMFMDVRFWERFKEGALIWDQLKKAAGLSKFIDEDKIKIFTEQFEFINKFDPNEKIID